ncbi:hypothetical protein E4U17_001902 [Claviceps sp. LM77 group G4]|nr:hypothetical protein E4U17_001902 [Claviceps sp. LM77 group G4]
MVKKLKNGNTKLSIDLMLQNLEHSQPNKPIMSEDPRQHSAMTERQFDAQAHDPKPRADAMLPAPRNGEEPTGLV